MTFEMFFRPHEKSRLCHYCPEMCDLCPCENNNEAQSGVCPHRITEIDLFELGFPVTSEEALSLFRMHVIDDIRDVRLI